MYVFQKINPIKPYKLNVELCWYLFIKDEKSLKNWFFETQEPIIIHSVKNYLDSYEFEQITNKKGNACHYSSHYGHFIHINLLNRSLVENDITFGFIDGVTLLTHAIFDIKLAALNCGKHVYINKVGGCIINDKELPYSETLKKRKCIFPEYSESDIRVIRWPNGKHCYAKIGAIDVEVDGESKWNTYDMAYSNALKFLKKINRGSGGNKN